MEQREKDPALKDNGADQSRGRRIQKRGRDPESRPEGASRDEGRKKYLKERFDQRKRFTVEDSLLTSVHRPQSN